MRTADEARRGRELGAAGPVDRRLILLALALVGFGLLMVYSASSRLSLLRFDNGHAFLESQAVKAAAGLLAMVAVARMDYHAWERVSKPLLWGSLGLLLVTVVPGTEGFTPEINGARRWIVLPGLSFQPAEIVKFASVVWMAAVLSRKGAALERFSTGPLPLCVAPAAGMGLLILQPDFGSALFLALTVGCMLFLGGVRWRHLLLIATSAVPAFVVLAVREPYRLRRLLAFTEPEKYLDSLSYQVHQSLIGLGSGGLLGVGIGGSKQKFFFLPEAHTDFIFSIIGEELGFAGAALTLGAFLYLAWIGFGIACRAPDGFGMLLAAGLTCIVALGALFNIGVATGNLPTTGLTLPFISYGATSLTMSLVSMGVLMNLSRSRVIGGGRVLPRSNHRGTRRVQPRPVRRAPAPASASPAEWRPSTRVLFPREGLGPLQASPGGRARRRRTGR